MLRIDNLRITLRDLKLLRGLDLELDAGATHGLVGESGSGKSLTALAIMGLLPPAMRVEGQILFQGQELIGLPDGALDGLRGRRIGMIFQEPMTSLNPVHAIGDQIAEGLVLHAIAGRAEALREAERLLDRVGLDNPARRLASYPHQLSGGQRQRVMIAMAIACKPALLVADEPTSALDVTVQAEILDLLREIQLETGMAMLFISHDLAVVSRVARGITVMYGGSGMETGATDEVLRHARHPYTRGLLAALPHGRRKGERLAPIPGQVPPPQRIAPGCAFHGRCPRGDEACRQMPPPVSLGATRARCFHPQDREPEPGG
jgi:peptide/nickel transport system ATP-binding protein